jgi:hypothetical protein
MPLTCPIALSLVLVVAQLVWVRPEIDKNNPNKYRKILYYWVKEIHIYTVYEFPMQDQYVLWEGRLVDGMQTRPTAARLLQMRSSPKSPALSLMLTRLDVSPFKQVVNSSLEPSNRRVPLTPCHPPWRSPPPPARFHLRSAHLRTLLSDLAWMRALCNEPTQVPLKVSSLESRRWCFSSQCRGLPSLNDDLPPSRWICKEAGRNH